MEFAYGERVEELRQRTWDFMKEAVFPAEERYERERVEKLGTFWYPSFMDDLKTRARAAGLWNLFLPDDRFGAGLSNLEYAPIAEISGYSPFIAPEAMNSAAPDTGNMEILAEFGTPQQQGAWLEPLLAGEIRSCFSMTEPDVASSDASNISTRIERDGDDYVVTGRKWWSSGAMSDRCKIAIVMGVTSPDAQRYRRQSMILVPLDTPGVRIVRSTGVLGYDDGSHGGHAVIAYEGVRVPASNLLGTEGSGFEIAQARLGPGRIHHCMRLIGMAERAFTLMCERAHTRRPFGQPLADQGVIREWVAEARIRIEQVRLLVLRAAWLIDTVGKKEARNEISAIKIAAPAMASWVIDHAMQVHGGAGLSDDFPLAQLYAQARLLRIADGPDEVHRYVLGRRELQRHAPTPTGT